MARKMTSCISAEHRQARQKGGIAGLSAALPSA
jgi:hypothetical protein